MKESKDMTFTKLDHGIIHSSIWSEPLPTRILWITMLAMKDDSGFVASSRSGLIRAANITPDEFDKAIKCLESPDEESRTRDYDGRRVEKVEGGWVILNHEKYRLHEDLKKEKHREYMRKWRDKKDSVNNCEFTSDHVNLTSVSVSESVSSSVSKSSPKEESEGKTWKDDFNIYQAEEQAAYESLINDPVWIADRQKYHPNLDIKLSAEKAHKDYWSTEAAWSHKKKQRSKSCDWRRTYNNALTQRCNQVWKNKGPEMAGLFND